MGLYLKTDVRNEDFKVVSKMENKKQKEINYGLFHRFNRWGRCCRGIRFCWRYLPRDSGRNLRALAVDIGWRYPAYDYGCFWWQMSF